MYKSSMLCQVTWNRRTTLTWWLWYLKKLYNTSRSHCKQMVREDEWYCLIFEHQKNWGLCQFPVCSCLQQHQLLVPGKLFASFEELASRLPIFPHLHLHKPHRLSLGLHLLLCDCLCLILLKYNPKDRPRMKNSRMRRKQKMKAAASIMAMGTEPALLDEGDCPWFAVSITLFMPAVFGRCADDWIVATVFSWLAVVPVVVVDDGTGVGDEVAYSMQANCPLDVVSLYPVWHWHDAPWKSSTHCEFAEQFKKSHSTEKWVPCSNKRYARTRIAS